MLPAQGGIPCPAILQIGRPVVRCCVITGLGRDPLTVIAMRDTGIFDGDVLPGLLDQAVKQLPEIVRSREFKAQMTRFVDSATVAPYAKDAPKTKTKPLRKQLPSLAP